MAKRAKAYRLAPLAVQDLEGVYLYTLRTWSLRQAESYIGDLVAAFEGLAAGVKTGRMADVAEGYFKMPVGSHVIFYRDGDDAIDIIRVLHQAMDASRHLKP
jgi:toxin ParE1/3/4